MSLNPDQAELNKCMTSYFGERLKELVVPSCSVKKVFLEISRSSQENTCARISVQLY